MDVKNTVVYIKVKRNLLNPMPECNCSLLPDGSFERSQEKECHVHLYLIEVSGGVRKSGKRKTKLQPPSERRPIKFISRGLLSENAEKS